MEPIPRPRNLRSGLDLCSRVPFLISGTSGDDQRHPLSIPYPKKEFVPTALSGFHCRYSTTNEGSLPLSLLALHHCGKFFCQLHLEQSVVCVLGLLVIGCLFRIMSDCSCKGLSRQSVAQTLPPCFALQNPAWPPLQILMTTSPENASATRCCLGQVGPFGCPRGHKSTIFYVEGGQMLKGSPV